MDPSNNDDTSVMEDDDASTEGESYWDALDLSGVRLRALSVNICHCALHPLDTTKFKLRHAAVALAARPTRADFLAPSADKHLTQLYLNNNAMESFPAVVCMHLNNLRDLDLSFNMLTALPQEVGEVRTLRCAGLASPCV